MTAIALTASRIARAHPDRDEVYDFKASTTITAGQIVYLVVATGTLGIADANGASALLQPIGVALKAGLADDVIPVLKRGYCYGFTVSSVAYYAPLYLSDTAGALDDAPGTSSNLVGRVVPLTDTGTLTKVVYVEFKWMTVFS